MFLVSLLFVAVQRSLFKFIKNLYSRPYKIETVGICLVAGGYCHYSGIRLCHGCIKPIYHYSGIRLRHGCIKLIYHYSGICGLKG